MTHFGGDICAIFLLALISMTSRFYRVLKRSAERAAKGVPPFVQKLEAAFQTCSQRGGGGWVPRAPFAPAFEVLMDGGVLPEINKIGVFFQNSEIYMRSL